MTSNYINYTLTDVLSSLGALIVTLAFLQVWKPKPNPKYAVSGTSSGLHATAGVGGAVGAWLPWIVVTVVVILWTTFGIAALGDTKIAWPGLHKAISITLYQGTPYAAIWDFQPLVDRYRHPRRGDHHGLARSAVGRRLRRLRAADVETDAHPDRNRHAHHRPGLFDELLGFELHAGLGRRVGGIALRPIVAVFGMGRGVSLRQRHFR